MMYNNCVMFKGKKDGLMIVLDEKIDFSILKAVFTKKVMDAHKFFGNATTGVTFQGRELTEEEEQELLEIVSTRSNLQISYVNELTSDKSAGNSELLSSLPVGVEKCLFHRSSLRSGQAVRYAGSIVIVGDVNPGGEVVAEGNVIVLGALKGMVHAGCSGNTDCIVSALNLSPVQLRIADVISYIPPELRAKNKSKPIPSYAYIQEGQIYIAQL